MLKHMELEICSEMLWMSVRLVVRLRCLVNYNGNRNGIENNPNCETNEVLAFQSLK
ncbi:hypothetical protein Hdeb2414_s0001g00020231 [Helianthus debilis subsp. tardiflorus]